ncbi:hypothetical protein ABTY61_39785 [Kitasatospora sp. NPDC096128]|uniref:hypothetical protein n=1 Tax=Kitasatospora sp. NPDC096128 TaxID=3155547 RepID=UPI003319E2B4
MRASGAADGTDQAQVETAHTDRGVRCLAENDNSAASTTGAPLGAAHGVDALPAELPSRPELAWMLDALARDPLQQDLDSPGGGNHVPPRDPHWRDRYPGW